MPRYETAGFEPPAPVVRARVSGPEQFTRTDVPLLLDTGADVSVVPLAVAQAVGATIGPADAPVQYLVGEATTYDQAILTVEIDRYRFHGRFLVADTDYGVLGRNVMNLLILTLDGPALTWTFGEG